MDNNYLMDIMDYIIDKKMQNNEDRDDIIQYIRNVFQDIIYIKEEVDVSEIENCREDFVVWVYEAYEEDI